MPTLRKPTNACSRNGERCGKDKEATTFFRAAYRMISKPTALKWARTSSPPDSFFASPEMSRYDRIFYDEGRPKERSLTAVPFTSTRLCEYLANGTVSSAKLRNEFMKHSNRWRSISKCCCLSKNRNDKERNNVVKPYIDTEALFFRDTGRTFDDNRSAFDPKGFIYGRVHFTISPPRR